MAESLSIVPLPTRGLDLACAWSGSQPVIPIQEFARAMGVKKRSIEQLRWRHPEIKIEPKVLYSLCSTFGRLVTEFGEVTLPLETPGGPQDMVCFTMYGAFLCATLMLTPQARRFVREFPLLMEEILTGRLKPPIQVAEIYRAILNAPRGQRESRIREACVELGKPRSTMWRHYYKLLNGEVAPDGLPLMRRPGPPKGFRSKLIPEMQSFVLDLRQSGVSKVGCHEALIAEFSKNGGSLPIPSLTAVQRFLI